MKRMIKIIHFIRCYFTMNIKLKYEINIWNGAEIITFHTVVTISPKLPECSEKIQLSSNVLKEKKYLLIVKSSLLSLVLSYSMKINSCKILHIE